MSFNASSGKRCLATTPNNPIDALWAVTLWLKLKVADEKSKQISSASSFKLLRLPLSVSGNLLYYHPSFQAIKLSIPRVSFDTKVAIKDSASWSLDNMIISTRAQKIKAQKQEPIKIALPCQMSKQMEIKRVEIFIG